MRILVTLSICTFLALLSIQSISQQRTYVPRETYSRKDSKLGDEVDKLLDAEINSLKSEKSPEVIALNEARKKSFRWLLVQQYLIKDDTLEGFVSRVLRKLENSNQLERKVRYFFITKDPVVNASCLGNGVFLINTGLLAKVKTEDELAFTLAHEIAHDELHHNIHKIKWLDKTKFRKKQQERLEIFMREKDNMDELIEFRKMNFAFSRIHRKFELEADSLGGVFFKNAGYKPDQAISLLQLLDESTKPKYPLLAETFLEFHHPEYPFDEYWLRGEIISFDDKGSFLGNLDSMRTHPDIPLRKKAVASYFNDALAESKSPQPLPADMVQIAEFEAVESAFFTRQYERCLLQAMVLLQNHPHDPYLIARIGGIFLQLHLAKQDGQEGMFFGHLTPEYSEELKLTGLFLNNLSDKETAEILYHFLRRPENFNTDNKDHYYILWKICDLTYKSDERNSIAEQYGKKFHQNIAFHDYHLDLQRNSKIFDFMIQGGWMFGL